MINKQLLLSTLLFVILRVTGVQAQESIHTSGGNVSGSGGSVSYTIGQLVYSTHGTENASLTEGVQQPYEVTVLTAIDEAEEITLTAFPNPSTDFLQIKVEGENFTDLNYMLFDMQGKLLQSGEITDNQARIAMYDLLATIYFVKILRNNNEIKTFKIIKK